MKMNLKEISIILYYSHWRPYGLFT